MWQGSKEAEELVYGEKEITWGASGPYLCPCLSGSSKYKVMKDGLSRNDEYVTALQAITCAYKLQRARGLEG